MTKKNLLLIFLALGLAVVYAVWFTNWFRPAIVRISHTSRESRANMRRGNMESSLIFRVSPQMRFTDVKVVQLDMYQTNKNVVPAWHLVSESNSVPVQDFIYGEFIRGMHPAFKGVRAEPLQTNVTYRLLVTGGKMIGEHDFELK